MTFILPTHAAFSIQPYLDEVRVCPTTLRLYRYRLDPDFRRRGDERRAAPYCRQFAAFLWNSFARRASECSRAIREAERVRIDNAAVSSEDSDIADHLVQRAQRIIKFWQSPARQATSPAGFGSMTRYAHEENLLLLPEQARDDIDFILHLLDSLDPEGTFRRAYEALELWYCTQQMMLILGDDTASGDRQRISADLIPVLLQRQYEAAVLCYGQNLTQWAVFLHDLLSTPNSADYAR